MLLNELFIKLFIVQIYNLKLSKILFPKHNHFKLIIETPKLLNHTIPFKMSTTTDKNQKHFKFMFQAHVKTVSLALKFPCVVSVIWKRG